MFHSSLSLTAIISGLVDFSLHDDRLAKKANLMSLVGYLIRGVIPGGSVLGVISLEKAGSTSFLTDIEKKAGSNK